MSSDLIKGWVSSTKYIRTFPVGCLKADYILKSQTRILHHCSWDKKKLLPITTYDEQSHDCIMLTGDRTYYEAVALCHAYGMHVAKIDQEHKALTKLISSQLETPVYVWTSLRFIQKSQQWTWQQSRWKDNHKISTNNQQFNYLAQINHLHKYCFKVRITINGDYNYTIADCNERLPTICWRPYFGNWGVWSEWYPCPQKACKSVDKERIRLCNSPFPSKADCVPKFGRIGFNDIRMEVTNKLDDKLANGLTFIIVVATVTAVFGISFFGWFHVSRIRRKYEEEEEFADLSVYKMRWQSHNADKFSFWSNLPVGSTTVSRNSDSSSSSDSTLTISSKNSEKRFR
ncbi:unnamed protein product [Dimorphilus gyrociliatus]|uniref:C-type lectin domain-containing protein n=1 Tax=Dimorphilus gyrociliatus TaxID=2664684 RepID=A0A7I8VM09_9ANNE|nr:unnamed protein product [Dimorphilus gyrociliatus]